MIEVTGDLWTYPADYRLITTNGTVKKNGECVMGRGCAFEAKRKYPHLAKDLGELIQAYGNRVWGFPNTNLISFPVKHNWYEKADLELIKRSTKQLEDIARLDYGITYVLPRPGCGNGGRKWEEVKPIVSILPDNVHVITKGD